jgi:hypothetical protein
LSSRKLEEVSRKGDMVAFADLMLVMFCSRSELEMILNEIANLYATGTCDLKKLV